MKLFKQNLAICLLFTLLLSTTKIYAAKPYQAPEWEVSNWFNGEGTSLAQLRGRVVVVDFFQLWCQGCKSFSIPLIKQWEAEFKPEIEAQKISFVSIHSVFEGHDYQTIERLQQFLTDKEITHLVGHDKHKGGGEPIPVSMKRFRVRGTPEILVIDQQGIVRFQHFGQFDGDKVKEYIRGLITPKQPLVEPVS